MVTDQIKFMAESGIQVKRLREFIVGDDVKKLVTFQISIVSKSGIQVKRLWK